jgi:diguanylate cyclase (GGDEF)-like protein
MYLFIEQELNKASLHGYPVTLLMLDLDGFKRVNDQFGHQVGDEMLRDIAKVMNGQIRRDDILVRYAGDEFVAVLIGTTVEQTQEVIARMQRAVEDHRVVIRGKTISVGVSIGQAVYPDSGGTLEELLIVADENMYRNKDEHRVRDITLSQMRATS